MKCEFDYSVPITESATLNGDFIIKGVAISETTTSNNHTFLSEELRPSAKTLIGVPLLADHNNSIDSIKGRVFIAQFDEYKKAILFEAKVVDAKCKELIKQGLLSTVSIGCIVDNVEEKDNDLVLRGIKFKELSLVAVPADENATFAIKFGEAYNSKKEIVKPQITETAEVKVEVKEKTEEEVKEEIRETVRRIEKEIISQSIDNENLMKGGLTMEDAKKIEESLNILQSENAQLKAKLEEHAKKERLALEKAYSTACAKKQVKAMDISNLSSETITSLLTQLEEVKVEEKQASKYNIVQEAGSLKGGAFSFERY